MPWCGTQTFHPCIHLIEKVGTYLLDFSISREQKSDRKPFPFGCLCAILTPHIRLLPQRSTLMHFALRIRFRFDRRWTSFPVSDRPFAFSPQRGSPVSAKTASLLGRTRDAATKIEQLRTSLTRALVPKQPLLPSPKARSHFSSERSKS